MLQCQLMMSILVTFLILPVGLTSTYLLVKAQKYLSWGKTNKGLKYLKVGRSSQFLLILLFLSLLINGRSESLLGCSDLVPHRVIAILLF